MANKIDKNVFAQRVWRTFTAGGIELYRGGYFGKQQKDRFYVGRLADEPVFKQLCAEAKVEGFNGGVHEDDIDKLNDAASKRDIPLILIEPDVDADESVN